MTRPANTLRLLHTSDVHLETDSFGNGDTGQRLKRRVRDAFSEVVAIANRRSVDLLLIVGDLFDSSRVSDEALSFALDTIARAQMPVVMIPGNHDAHDERSIYAPVPRERLPGNLRLILDPAGEMLTFPELHTRVWGRALVEHRPDYRPLLGIPPSNPEDWNIAMAHGFFTDEAEELMRSSPITSADVELSGYDYIALGHVHVFTDVSRGATRALYCGTPAPLYASDEAGWVAYVTCTPGAGVTAERLRVAS